MVSLISVLTCFVISSIQPGPSADGPTHPGPTAAAAVALMVRAASPPGPKVVAVAITVRAAPPPRAPLRAAPGPGILID